MLQESIKIKNKDLNKIERAIKLLNETMFDIQEYIPEANLFVNGEYRTSLHIMLRKYESENKRNEWKNSSCASFEIYSCDCGGF